MTVYELINKLILIKDKNKNINIQNSNGVYTTLLELREYVDGVVLRERDVSSVYDIEKIVELSKKLYKNGIDVISELRKINNENKII